LETFLSCVHFIGISYRVYNCATHSPLPIFVNQVCTSYENDRLGFKGRIHNIFFKLVNGPDKLKCLFLAKISNVV
jgi:hypothetical protein